MTLTEHGYLPRLLDARLAQDLQAFGAVSVVGPKWCGKTWTCLNQAQSVFYLMDPAGAYANRQLAALDPDAALAGAPPHLIDEWQEVVELWDAVRFRVDRGRARGLFLLTGSTKPASKQPLHSGAGRFADRRMRPMTLVESGDSDGSVSLGALAEGASIPPAKSDLQLDQLIYFACRGGWPAALDVGENQAREMALSYLDRLAYAEIPDVDGVRRDPSKTRPFLSSLARHSASLVNAATLRRDMAQAFGAAATAVTVNAYLEALRKLYVLEELPPWSPQLRSRTPLRKAPKRFLADPSLTVAGLAASPATLRADLNTLGFVFETLVLRDLLVIADMLGGRLSHFRDDRGLEADAVMTLPDGRWGAIEVKLGFTQVDQAAAQLLQLARQVVEGGGGEPAFLAVVVGVGAIAQSRADGVHVVPVDKLGP
jgi:predicted AAA+ superfamily ATPase